MNATHLLSTVFIASSLVGAPAFAKQASVEEVVGDMLSDLMAHTAHEIQLDVQQAVANTVYFFEPDTTHNQRGTVNIKDLSAAADKPAQQEESQEAQM